MTMHLIIAPQDSEPRSLAEILHRAPRLREFDRARLAGIVLTALLHVGVIGAIVYGGIQAARDVVPAPILIALDKPKVDATRPPPPPPPVPLVRPPAQFVQAPEIAIVADVPPPIQTVAAPEPVVHAEPPPPPAATGETQQSYLARLLGYLNRYKRYPAQARAARIQGVVLLHFVMDKTGHITAFDINKSSGKPALDEEALALIQRAQPLPPIPADFGKDTINAIVPIEFSLR